MIKLIFALLLSLSMSFSAQALYLETQWSEASEKSLLVTCNEDAACEQFCDGESCEVKEKVCKNCVSTSISMTFAFKEMGRAIIAKEPLDPYALFDLIASGSFVSLTSRSVYNIVERFDSMALRRKFRSLCNDGTRYPQAIFDTLPSGAIGAPHLVWCESGLFKLEQVTELLEGSNLY